MDRQTFSNSDPQYNEGDFWHQFGEEWQEILAAYALGALEPDEMIALDDYLQHHPELQGVVQRLDEVAAGIAYTAPAALPSPGTKTMLMGRIQEDLRSSASSSFFDSAQSPAVAPAPQRAFDSERQSSFSNQTSSRAQQTARQGAESTALSRYRPDEPLRPAVRPPRSQMGHASQRRVRGSVGFFDFATGWKVATMATAAALLFFIIATVQLTGQLSQLSTQGNDSTVTLAAMSAELEDAQAALTALRQEADTLRAENSQLQSTTTELAQRLQVEEQQLTSLLTVSQVVELGGTEFAPDAEGALFVGPNSLVLILHGLMPLPTNQTYQLWLIPAEEAPISAGLVHVTENQETNLTTDVTLSTTSFAAVGLSVEPVGGSEQPTGNIVMLGNRT